MIIKGRYVIHNGIPKPLYITDGWSLDDIASVEDCDRAQALLVKAITSLERTTKAAETMPDDVDRRWLHRAAMALQCKQAALTEVEKIRAELVGNPAAAAV
jgi:hypothetical protein